MFSLVTVLLRPNTSSHISSFFVTEATLRCRIDDQKSSRSQHHFGHWDLNMGRWLRGLRLISSDRIHHLNKESGNEYGFPFWNITRDIPSSFSFGWPCRVFFFMQICPWYFCYDASIHLCNQSIESIQQIHVLIKHPISSYSIDHPLHWPF